jgi:hypothetical protein
MAPVLAPTTIPDFPGFVRFQVTIPAARFRIEVTNLHGRSQSEGAGIRVPLDYVEKEKRDQISEHEIVRYWTI